MLAKNENKSNNSKSGNDSPILDLNNSAMKSLIKKGKLNGFVTLDELNQVLPPGEYSSEQIEDIHSAINDMGLNIIDQHEETSLEELDDKNCRWPIGHPDEENFYFCGRTSLKDFSYCKLHLLYSYQSRDSKNKKDDQIDKDEVPEFIGKKIKSA